MALTRPQKKYLKKNLKSFPLAKIAADLDVSEKQLHQFLKSHWRKEKYYKFSRHLQDETKLRPRKPQNCWRIRDKHFGDGWVKQNWKVLAVLSFLVLAVYLNSLGNEFVSDDIPAFLENKNLGSFGYVFSQPLTFIRRLPYFFAYKIGNLNPFFFRIVNIIFHLGTVWLVYALISLMVSSSLAFFTAGIFAVHPILTESVTWISGGGYCQYSFFLLLSFLLYILSKKKRRFYSTSILAFFFSLSSSEKAIILPLVFLLFETAQGEFGKNWKKLIPFFAVSGFWTLYLFGALGERVASLETTYYQEPGLTNPFIQIPVAVTSYLELIFWPKNLTFYHSKMIFSQGEYLLRLGGFFLFLAATIYFFKKSRWIFFWLSFFLISLLPYLTPFKISWLVAERYVYLGALGIFVLAGMMIEKIGKISKNQKLAYFLLVIILLALSFRTIIRNTDWKSQDSLWLATAKTSPESPQNHNNLGDLYFRRGDFEKAEEEFQTAIRLKPDYGDVYHNLANVYREVGKDDLAIENYQKALSINSNLWQSYQNIAAIYFQRKDYESAKQNLEKAIAINPQNAELYAVLGVFHLSQNENEKAKEAFLKALRIDPNYQRAKEYLLQTE